MTSINLQQKNYKADGEEYQVFLPRNYEVIIPEDDSVRLLSQIVEEMDLRELYAAYSSEGRNPAIEPKTLFKVMTYAYMECRYSTRKIESACRRDINYMWLLKGQAAPDHTTISRFRKERLGGIMEGLFYQFVEKLCELGEVKYKNVFGDGTTIEANANRYTYVWSKAVEKNEGKMLLKVEGIGEEIRKLYSESFSVSKERVDEGIKEMIDFLEEKKREESIEFVHGAGKRKSNVQKLLEALYTYEKRQMGYEESKRIFEGRSSYSRTDRDATFMRMKDDHGKRGQLKPGYNVQLAVEGEYVIGAGVFSECNDVGTLKALMEKMFHYNPGMEIERLTTDAGYESEENYVYLESKGIEYYIKPQNYEQRKKRSFKKNIGKRENMAYNKETDEYTCHNGKQLRAVGVIKKKSSTGYTSEVTVYECESCDGCAYKSKCTKAKGNRRMEISKVFLEKREKSYENITSKIGILLRMNRSIQMEGAFGIIKEDRQFRRFLTRGKPNVTTEVLLVCFGYNVNKLHAKIQSERCGKDLHEPKSA